MAQRQPAFHSFLYSVSTRLTRGGDSNTVLAHLVKDASRRLNGARVTAELAPKGGTPQIARSVGTSTKPCRFSYSREINIRGVTRAKLSVEVTALEGNPADWVTTLETFAMQLGLYAERIALAEEHFQLNEELQDLNESLRVRKTLARATAIVARTLQIPPDAAEKRIRAEAAERGRSIRVVAEQIMLHHAVASQLAGGDQEQVAA